MKLILFLLIYFCGFQVNAQIFLKKDIAGLLSDDLLEMENMQNVSEAFIQQISNVAYVNQAGTGMTAHLKQTGMGNEANLWQKGGLINQEVTQDGNENVINSYIKNLDLFGKTAYFLQEGNNNRIELAVFGEGFSTNEQTIKIMQQGDGFEAKALMGTFNSPIEIIQKAGSGGGMMKIDISVSNFGFPMK